MTLRLHSVMVLIGSAQPYSLYVLFVLMVVYTLNQLDRFVLGIAGRNVARDLQFGALDCYLNTSDVNDNASSNCITSCSGIHTESMCLHTDACTWDHTDTGIEYEILAGPAFTVVFTLLALPFGLLAGFRRVNRRVIIALCLTLWSGMTLAASFTQSFWQLLLTRMGLGIFEAVCTPFASSIISDMFTEDYRATALGFYNWGIYIGYSLAFAFNFILMAVGWRWTFRVAALPGFLVGGVMLVTVKEPLRFKHVNAMTVYRDSFFLQVLKSLLTPSLLLLCLAGGVRQGGGLVWSYNVKSFFSQYYCSSISIGTYLSWVPLVGGTLGAVLGGLVSDKLVRSRGQVARLWVLIISQLLACPFLVGSVMLPPDPWASLCLLPAYVVGEMWIGVCLAVVIEMVPRRVIPVAVAFFLFVINNIGGALPLLVPYLEMKLNLRYTLLLLFPGSYVLAAVLFSITLIVTKCKQCCRRRKIEEEFLIQVEDDFESLSNASEILESQETLIVIPQKRTRTRLSSNSYT